MPAIKSGETRQTASMGIALRSCREVRLAILINRQEGANSTALSCVFDETHMRGDNAPALRKTHPGLHPPARPSLATLARWNNVEATAKSRPYVLITVRESVSVIALRAGAAERFDLVVTVEVLAAAIADSTRIVPEYGVESSQVVLAQRLFVAVEFGSALRRPPRAGQSP